MTWRLIATAPELLAVCEALIKSYMPDKQAFDILIVRHAFQEAQKAIAKVKDDS